MQTTETTTAITDDTLILDAARELLAASGSSKTAEAVSWQSERGTRHGRYVITLSDDSGTWDAHGPIVHVSHGWATLAYRPCDRGMQYAYDVLTHRAELPVTDEVLRVAAGRDVARPSRRP